MKDHKNLFIFVGERSGDLHGSHLIEALKCLQPSLTIEGVSGPRLRALGIDGLLTMEDFEVMGLTDVICALPKIYRHFYKIRDHILHTSPEAVILIDYPGFNLRLATALRKVHYSGKIIHYISPSIWAHGRHRIQTMAASLDLLLTIYPFEGQYFQDYNKSATSKPLQVKYVGNPLSEYIKNYSYDNQWQQKLGIPSTADMIALFPGSRQSEVKRNLPIMLEAAELLKNEYPETIFCVSCALPETIAMLAQHPLHRSLFHVPKEYTYELMRDSRTAIAKSGTVTLELAIHERPTVVIYQLTYLNRLYAQYILKVKLPHYCIVNILADRMIFPELINTHLSAKDLLTHLKQLHADVDTRSTCIAGCKEVRSLLGTPEASKNAARAIMDCLSC